MMTERHELVFLAVLGLILGLVVCTAICHRADNLEAREGDEK